MIRLGIDLGGTKIELLAMDDSGRELFRQRRPTPQGNYTATLASIVALVDEAEQKLGKSASIGIGTPGSCSPATGLMRNANSTCLNHMPLKQDLEKLLCRPVKMANDANCFVTSEATDGAGQGALTVFGIILGTGTGAGLSLGGTSLLGCNGIAGEWGHNPLPWPEADEIPGPPCYCGQRGCIETFLSGPGLSRDHALHNQETLQARQIHERALQQDPSCEQTLRRYENRLARALATVINIVDPEVIVLGGGLSNMPRLYRNVPQRWKKYIFSDTVGTRLLPAKFGDASGVRGAAWL